MLAQGVLCSTLSSPSAPLLPTGSKKIVRIKGRRAARWRRGSGHARTRPRRRPCRCRPAARCAASSAGPGSGSARTPAGKTCRRTPGARRPTVCRQARGSCADVQEGSGTAAGQQKGAERGGAHTHGVQNKCCSGCGEGAPQRLGALPGGSRGHRRGTAGAGGRLPGRRILLAAHDVLHHALHIAARAERLLARALEDDAVHVCVGLPVLHSSSRLHHAVQRQGQRVSGAAGRGGTRLVQLVQRL